MSLWNNLDAFCNRGHNGQQQSAKRELKTAIKI